MRKVIMKAMIFLLSFLLIIMFNKNMYAKEDVNVNAQSYILMESSSKRVLCGKNINNKYLTASICKIMTAIIIIERCNIDDYVLIDETTTLQEGSKVYLKQNDLIRIRDLLYGLLLRSGNDCAYLLAKSCCNNVEDFVVLMNQYAKEIGMNNTIFNNPSGLDNSDSNYSTAYDMALLMSYAMQNEVFKEINQTTKYSFSTASDVKYTFYNKHKLINGYDYVIGGKTGYTKKAHRTLVSYASKDKMDLICVTFNCNDDWNTHLMLFDYGYKNYDMEKIIDSQIVKTKKDYFYTPYIDIDIYLPKRKKEKLEVVIYLYENVKTYDSELGYLVIYSSNKEIYRRDVLKYL